MSVVASTTSINSEMVEWRAVSRSVSIAAWNASHAVSCGAAGFSPPRRWGHASRVPGGLKPAAPLAISTSVNAKYGERAAEICAPRSNG
jgi:hypothetical protein